MRRRAFLAGLTALSLPKPSWADVGLPYCLAAGKQGPAYVLHGLSRAGESLFSLPLPARGHAAAAHPSQPLAVAFARRPGTFAVVLDCLAGDVRHELSPPPGRQFNGHGAFSADGRVLYTSEVVAETSEGRVGLWEAEGYRRIGEWASGGIGPHEVRLTPDGGLIVANGGIQTDPQDRSKLNLGSMRPNLSRLDPTGRITEQAELPPEFWQNSIRHIALGADGTVAFAMQWEGDPTEAVPQLGLWQPGVPPRLCPPPEAEAYRMQGYAGSVAINAAGQIAITSPRGGVVMIFGPDGGHLASHSRTEVCGITGAGDGFLASDGLGALWQCDTGGLTALSRHGTQWDNHVVALG